MNGKPPSAPQTVLAPGPSALLDQFGRSLTVLTETFCLNLLCWGPSLSFHCTQVKSQSPHHSLYGPMSPTPAPPSSSPTPPLTHSAPGTLASLLLLRCTSTFLPQALCTYCSLCVETLLSATYMAPSITSLRALLQHHSL